MNTRHAVVPDFNINEQIEAISQTAGAYVGAATTALVGGIATGLTNLFRGAVAGAQATYANTGNQQVPVENTAASRKAALTADVLGDVTEADLQELLKIKRERQLAGSVNGHS